MYKGVTFLVLFVIISAAFLFHDFFAPGLPTGHDLGTHYYLAMEKYALLAETGFWDGLLPQWYLGFSPFAYYPDLFYLIFAGAKWLLSSVVSDVTLYKVLLIAVFYLPVVGAHYLSYTLCKSSFFAFLTAIMVVSVSVFAGAGIEGHFYVGLINQTLGTGLYLFCIAFFIRWQKSQSELRLTVLALCFFILITQAHLITLAVTMLSLTMLILWNLVDLTNEEPMEKKLLSLKSAALLWCIPVVICVGGLLFRVVTYWSEHGARSGWGDVPLFEQTYSGALFSTGAVNVAAGIMIILGFFLKRFRSQAIPVAILFFSLLILGGGYLKFDGILDIFNSVFNHRAWGFAGVLGMVLAGITLSYVWEFGGTRSCKTKYVLRSVVAIVSSFCIISAGVKVFTQSQTLHVASNSQAQQVPAYLKIMNRIEKETPPDSVLLFQLDELKGHEAPFLYLPSSLAVYTHKVLVQGQQMESSRLNFDDYIEGLNRASSSEACELFHRLGATHFLAWSDPVLGKMLKNPCFAEVMTEGHFHLFAYRQADYSRLMGAETISGYVHSRHRYSWNVYSAGEVNTLKLNFAYHPRFHVDINGQASQIERTSDNFIAVTVPRGKSTIMLEYKLPIIEIVFGVIEKTLTGLAAIFVFLYLFGWRRYENSASRLNKTR